MERVERVEDLKREDNGIWVGNGKGLRAAKREQSGV